MQFDSVQDVLDFAIREEQAAADLYRDLAGRADFPALAEALEDFAAEEERHKETLREIADGAQPLFSEEKVATLAVADAVADAILPDGFDYRQVLQFAMKKEKSAFLLYSALAARVEDPGVSGAFKRLAEEEARHKLRFEIEYEEHFLDKSY